MHDHFNYLSRKFLFGIAKWSAIGFTCLLIGIILSGKLLLPALNLTPDANDSKIVNIPGVGEQLVYNDKDTPKNYEEAMDKTAPQVILQNQNRFYEQFADSDHEDHQLTVKIPQESLNQITLLSREFLNEWETFEVNENKETYKLRIADYVTTDALGSIANREDNLQPKEIGTESGSYFIKPDIFINKNSMKVLSYDSETAYISVTGKVLYTGPSALWQGKELRRTYNLLLARENGEWRINRAVAQTLGDNG